MGLRGWCLAQAGVWGRALKVARGREVTISVRVCRRFSVVRGGERDRRARIAGREDESSAQARHAHEPTSSPHSSVVRRPMRSRRKPLKSLPGIRRVAGWDT